MTFFDFVRSLEALISELALWIVLFPKTYITMIFRPAKITGYCLKELEKPKDERFNEYISPTLFWMLGGALPFLLYFDTHVVELTVNTALLEILIPLLLPAAFAWQHLAECKEEVTATNFYKYLPCQLYISGVAMAPILITSLILAQELPDLSIKGTHVPKEYYPIIFMSIGAIIWFLYAEMVYARRNPAIKNAFLFILFSSIRAGILFFIFFKILEWYKPL